MSNKAVIKLRLDQKEAELLGSCLRGAYSSTLDAMGQCSGEPHYPSFKRTEPNYSQIELLRAQLDRIERLAKALGNPIYRGRLSRRPDVERYLAKQIENWQKVEEGIR